MDGTANTERPTRRSEPSFDFARTLTFFFEDPKWAPKLLVGSLFALLSPVLVGGVFIMGYALAIARQTMEGKTLPLPEWDDLPGLFVEGLKGLAISLAHKLPVIALIAIFLFALVGGMFLQREGGPASEEFMFYGIPALVGGWLVVFVLSLAVLVYVPAAFVRFLRTDRLGAAFDFMENVNFIRDHLSDYLMALVAIVLALFIAQLGFLVLCIGVFPASFWATCVGGYVVGELARLEGGIESESTLSS